MRTYSEIVADYERTVKETNNVLTALRPCGARWWGYAVSHRSFQLLVGQLAPKPNIAILMHWVSYLCGPTGWENQQLQVSWKTGQPDDTNSFEFTLEDKASEFCAIGRALRVQRDVNLDDLSRDYWRFSSDDLPSDFKE